MAIDTMTHHGRAPVHCAFVHARVCLCTHRLLMSATRATVMFLFGLFRTKCSQTGMTDKDEKPNTAQSHMHTRTPRVTNTPVHRRRPHRYNHGASEEDLLILITDRQTSS